MGILTSLAAAKYLFGGNGGGGSHHYHYVQPTPEQLARMEAEHAAAVERWNAFKEQFTEHTPIGIFLSKCYDGIAYLVFGSPGWWWFALLASFIALLTFMIINRVRMIDEVKNELTMTFLICSLLGTLILVLWALDSVFMLIRFVVWLFSPVF